MKLAEVNRLIDGQSHNTDSTEQRLAAIVVDDDYDASGWEVSEYLAKVRSRCDADADGIDASMAEGPEQILDALVRLEMPWEHIEIGRLGNKDAEFDLLVGAAFALNGGYLEHEYTDSGFNAVIRMLAFFGETEFDVGAFDDIPDQNAAALDFQRFVSEFSVGRGDLSWCVDSSAVADVLTVTHLSSWLPTLALLDGSEDFEAAAQVALVGCHSVSETADPFLLAQSIDDDKKAIELFEAAALFERTLASGDECAAMPGCVLSGNLVHLDDFDLVETSVDNVDLIIPWARTMCDAWELSHTEAFSEPAKSALKGTDVAKFFSDAEKNSYLVAQATFDTTTGLWALSLLGSRALHDVDALRMLVDFWFELPLSRIPIARQLVRRAFAELQSPED